MATELLEGDPSKFSKGFFEELAKEPRKQESCTPPKFRRGIE